MGWDDNDVTTGLPSRAVRAAIFAAVCVMTAALGHAWAAGAAVSPLALTCGFVAIWSAAWWPAGRERGAVAITASTVAAQLSLHELFAVLRLPAPTGTAVPEPAPHDTAVARLARAVGGAHSSHSGHFAHGTGVMGAMGSGGLHAPPMLFAHTLAASACGLWLWRGESAAFRLGRLVADRLFVPLRSALRVVYAAAAPEPPGCGGRFGAGPAVRGPRGALLEHVVSRRGPPGEEYGC